MKLSIVIISWNDRQDLLNCLRSVYSQTCSFDFEVIIADNGSTDGSLEAVRSEFGRARIVANGANIGFGPGNNAGIKTATGDYILLLNPDTLLHDAALEKLIAFADRHSEAGGFGCRVLNPDGSFQTTAQPAPTVFGYLLRAIYLRWPGRISDSLASDLYPGWEGLTERPIGFQAGCCLLVRGELLKSLGGFDPQFFHQFEDADLCHRIWKRGQTVLYFPGAVITHIGGQNRGRYPAKVVLETQRSKYRYFYKHYGSDGARRIRWVSLLDFGLRFAGYSLLRLAKPSQSLTDRLGVYRILLRWHWNVDPVDFVLHGKEPEVGCKPLAAAAVRLVEKQPVQA